MAVLSASRFAPDSRIAAAALAVIIAVVSLPLMGGWTVADARCALSMDICHPAQALDNAHAVLVVAAPIVIAARLSSPEQGWSIRCDYHVAVGRLCDAPEPPPPETLT